MSLVAPIPVFAAPAVIGGAAAVARMAGGLGAPFASAQQSVKEKGQRQPDGDLSGGTQHFKTLSMQEAQR